MGERGEKQKNKPLSPETLSIAQAYWRGQGEVKKAQTQIHQATTT
jgi:hypothetical protein